MEKSRYCTADAGYEKEIKKNEEKTTKRKKENNNKKERKTKLGEGKHVSPIGRSL
jgi:hypothetical protein